MDANPCFAATMTEDIPDDRQHTVIAHDRLREAILRGDIAPGAATSQVALAKQFGVSRTPLREALRLLEREGLIVPQPNRRVRIAEFSIADVESVYAMRIAVEAAGIHATVPIMREEDFAELEGLMAQMDHYIRARDSVRLDGPHSIFHAKFVQGGGQRLAAHAAQLFDHAARYRLAYGTANFDAGYEDRRAEHQAMLDAALAGDARLTAERMVRHYVHTARGVIAELDPDHEPRVLLAAVAAVAPDLTQPLAITPQNAQSAVQAE
jgi:DNA-binding GntR family transcriptional regulator